MENEFLEKKILRIIRLDFLEFVVAKFDPKFIKLFIASYWLKIRISLEYRVFANGPGDLGSISGRVIPKTQKMVLDISLLNTQHYKIHIKGKVEQSREKSSALRYTSV